MTEAKLRDLSRKLWKLQGQLTVSWCQPLGGKRHTRQLLQLRQLASGLQASLYQTPRKKR